MKDEKPSDFELLAKAIMNKDDALVSVREKHAQQASSENLEKHRQCLSAAAIQLEAARICIQTALDALQAVPNTNFIETKLDSMIGKLEVCAQMLRGEISQ